MSDEPDIGEAVDFILSERPKLHEDDIWAVLVELQDPPQIGGDALAVELIKQTRPDIRPRTVKVILKEWRVYVSLAHEPDWNEDEDEDE
jgi:hypothetical protein